MIDIHFHGAFGIDLMRAGPEELDMLASKLWKQGVAAFCPTTLSAPLEVLVPTLERLGSWIHSTRSTRSAIPLGIHLEGPFINPHSAGAHPPKAIQPLSLQALETLWMASHKTLKIITLAPETQDKAALLQVARWARRNKIILSLGHSQATEAQARLAFDCGVTGVTHAWNALSFHQRAPGVLGAALSRKDVYIEIIADRVHVSPTLIRWTCQLHCTGSGSRARQNPICFVSDCAPSAATRRGTWHSFGPLRAQLSSEMGGSRLPDGSLAGGGLLLPEAFRLWFENELTVSPALSAAKARKLLSETLAFVTRFQLKVLGISPAALKNRRLSWRLSQKPGGRFRLTWQHNPG
ncbi:MAG: hypothetical protein A2070_14295 [Bdellovibrionales bacterium GWC1_52_8]|nr:MAG: hypothetical protein A2X97_01720 [Bdellovibrionales bacterium GWA1_52_35]OFZ42669.1 MAG: hypothetical protein A2070_14295 [Bdellovibrionales bacterium GWC1_52_8]